MVPSAERDSELVTYLATERAGLRESKMVGVRGRAAADETRLLGDIAKVLPVAIAPRSRDCEDALIDAHLIGAGFIHLANLVTTSAATFRRVHVHDLSAFGRQELGEPFFKRFLQDLCIFCAEPILGCKSSLRPVRCTLLRLQASDLAH
jgi:hypothetical protein